MFPNEISVRDVDPFVKDYDLCSDNSSVLDARCSIETLKSEMLDLRRQIWNQKRAYELYYKINAYEASLDADEREKYKKLLESEQVKNKYVGELTVHLYEQELEKPYLTIGNQVKYQIAKFEEMWRVKRRSILRLQINKKELEKIAPGLLGNEKNVQKIPAEIKLLEKQLDLCNQEKNTHQDFVLNVITDKIKKLKKIRNEIGEWQPTGSQNPKDDLVVFCNKIYDVLRGERLSELSIPLRFD